MMDKQKTFEVMDMIVGQYPSKEDKLKIIEIDLLFEIRDKLKDLQQTIKFPIV